MNTAYVKFPFPMQVTFCFVVLRKVFCELFTFYFLVSVA